MPSRALNEGKKGPAQLLLAARLPNMAAQKRPAGGIKGLACCPEQCRETCGQFRGRLQINILCFLFINSSLPVLNRQKSKMLTGCWLWQRIWLW